MGSMPPIQFNSFVEKVLSETNENNNEVVQDLSNEKNNKNDQRSTDLNFKRPINMKIQISKENRQETIVSPLDLKEEEPKSSDQVDNSKIIEEFMNKNSMNTEKDFKDI